MNQSPAPILKWPGGKRRVLPHILPLLPPSFSAYYEPFFGGGALFFALAAAGRVPEKAVLADTNSDLVNLYRVVQTSPEALLDELRRDGAYGNTEEDFYRIRALDRDDDAFAALSPVVRAARTLYLNRTAFNGLYRLNRLGHFNVPYGKYSNPRIIDPEGVGAAHGAFAAPGVQLMAAGFEESLRGAEGGTGAFVYLDPPYLPLTATASFTRYAKGGFRVPDHENLSHMAKRLDEAGNFVLISNSDTPETRRIYEGFRVVPLQVKRSIGASATTRVNVSEVLLVGSTLASVLGLEG